METGGGDARIAATGVRANRTSVAFDVIAGEKPLRQVTVYWVILDIKNATGGSVGHMQINSPHVAEEIGAGM